MIRKQVSSRNVLLHVSMTRWSNFFLLYKLIFTHLNGSISGNSKRQSIISSFDSNKFSRLNLHPVVECILNTRLIRQPRNVATQGLQMTAKVSFTQTRSPLIKKLTPVVMSDAMSKAINAEENMTDIP